MGANYKSEKELPKICAEQKDSTTSMNFGYIIFNGAEMANMEVKDDIIFETSSTFQASNAFLKITTPETRQVLTAYAVTGPALPDNLAAFRLNINGKKIDSSLTLSHNGEFMSASGMAVQELPAADH